MVKVWDWIVVGGGLAGSALSYELAKLGLSVLLVEQSAMPENATRYSYGGIAYWSGTTDLTRQLCQEGLDIHRHLSVELEADTQFRELNLLLTINPDRDPDAILQSYMHFAVPPVLLTAEAACELEPLLNPEAIAGGLLLPHGHVSPEATVAAYQQAFIRLGGQKQLEQVTGFLRMGDCVQGVSTATTVYQAANVAVCAGGLSRSLLQTAEIQTRLYFTQAEIIETPPVEMTLQALVMPAEVERFDLEAIAGSLEKDSLWDEPDLEISPPILDLGVIQFLDGSLRIGQISRVCTNPQDPGNAAESVAKIQAAIGWLLPPLADVSGQWRSCLVSFSGDRLPLVGPLPQVEGLYLFSGFSNPFAILPSLARRFARCATGQTDALVQQLSPSRLLP
jgi:glycine/D-amino acid oxidase-like deaminating enzyme